MIFLAGETDQETIDDLLQQLQDSQNRERLLREALEEVINPMHKIHWQVVIPGNSDCYCFACRKIREALEESK